jgi:nicotinamidase-related amidase
LILVEGKEVFTEVEELVDPAHTALLLIDMQVDFVDPGGMFASLGIDLSMYDDIRPRLAALLAAAREHGVLVVHVQNTALPGRRSDSPAQIRFNLRMHEQARRDGAALRYTLPGTPGQAFVPELAPAAGEVVVPKYRSSGFWGTNLELVLRSNGIKTVVVGGCTTEGCVESTARDAMFTDHYVVIADDCVGSDDKAQHEASMFLMRHRFDLARSTDIAAVWRGERDTDEEGRWASSTAG